MRIITDISQASKEIQEIIAANGRLPQHHYQFFLCYPRKNEKPVFFSFEKKQGILAYQNGTIWRFLTDPVATEKERLKVFLKAADWFFKNKGEKIIFEDVTDNFHKEILLAAKGKNWRPIRTAYSLFWPVMDLKKWDPSLPGGEWKRLRNIRNKFFKENRVDFKKTSEVKKEDLILVATQWKKQRRDTDRIHFEQYLRLIEKNFSGFDLVRIMTINDRPAAINGGWQIPNSRNYYSCLGLYNYNFDGIGEVSYIDELDEAKKKGFVRMDLGGSYGGLLDFKNKFHPESAYRTDTFSISKE